MKIAGVSLWIWAVGITVAGGGILAWKFSPPLQLPVQVAVTASRPITPRVVTAQADPLPPFPPADPSIDIARQQHEIHFRQEVQKKLAQNRLSGLKYEIHFREIAARARAEGRQLRPQVVKNEEAESLSDAQLAALVATLEKSAP